MLLGDWLWHPLVVPDENDLEEALVEFPFLLENDINCWNFLENVLVSDDTSFESEKAAVWCISL